ASTYTWSPATGLDNPNSATPNATPGSTTVYTVNGTNASGCVSTTAGTTTVTINTPPTISVGAATYTVCPGGTVGISASGASTYTWSPVTGLDNPNSASPNSTPTVATVYTVTGTDASGCIASSSATTTVSINTPPTITVGSANYTVCPGGTVGMSVSGASTFTWSPASSLDNANSATPNSTPTTTTVYTVTGTDASGCTATTAANATVTINTPITPTITPSPASLCTGGTTTLTASGAATYTWSANAGGGSTNPVSVSPAGTDTYSVNGIDAAGCATNTGTVVVAVGAALTPTITASSTSMCSGQTTTLTASGASNYTWLPGNSNATSITVSPTSNQTYTLTGDNGGCSGSTTLIVTVTATPTLTTSSSSPGGICSGATATLTAGSATNYTWMPGSITTNTASVSPTTTTDYTVTGSDASGVCTSTAVVTVSVTTTPTVTASATASSATVCAGQTYTLTGNGASSYTWAPGPLVGSPQTVTPAAGVTTYTLIGSNGSCLSSLTTVTVSVTALPTMTVTGNSAAICSSDPAVTMTANGATNYTWMPGSVNTNTISVNPGTTTDYTVTGEAGGCKSTTVATLSVSPTPTLAITTTASSFSVCSGQSITMSGATALTYTWLPGTSLNSSSITVSPTSTQTYTLIGANGTCTASITQAVAVSSSPTITATPPSDSAHCAGSDGVIHPVNVTGGVGPYTYAWSNGTTGSVDSLAGVPAGTYSVLITDAASGCSTSLTGITVLGSPLIIASISPSSTQGQAPVSVNFGNGTTGAVAYNWDFGNGTGSVFQSPTVTYNTPGTYTVVMTASNGPMCFDRDTAIVIVDAATSIVIPNIFSPNGDGINDNFGIISTGIKTLNCDIFNRWGTKITSLTAPNQLWDGKTTSGNDATEGTYYYMLTAKGYDGKDYSYQGPLTLVK
ncbi:MAG: T9SS type B sorting domain-containing protein, partial [Bacteroidia bacterium]